MISMDSERLVKIQSSLIKFSMRLKGKICNTIKDFCGKNLTSYFIVQKEMPTPPHKNKAKISPFNIYSLYWTKSPGCSNSQSKEKCTGIGKECLHLQMTWFPKCKIYRICKLLVKLQRMEDTRSMWKSQFVFLGTLSKKLKIEIKMLSMIASNDKVFRGTFKKIWSRNIHWNIAEIKEMVRYTYL